MGSSAADSQLATARSQLRFQSAAFSSSLQTATQTILDENNKTGETKNPIKKYTRKRGHFQSSDGIAQRKRSLEQLCFVPQWRNVKRRGGYYGVEQSQTTSTAQQCFRQLYPQLTLLPQEDDPNCVQQCPALLPYIVLCSPPSSDRGGGTAQFNDVNHTKTQYLASSILTAKCR